MLNIQVLHQALYKSVVGYMRFLSRRPLIAAVMTEPELERSRGMVESGLRQKCSYTQSTVPQEMSVSRGNWSTVIHLKNEKKNKKILPDKSAGA